MNQRLRPMNQRLRFGTGHSEASESGEAARASVRAALGGRQPAASDLVFLFPALNYRTTNYEPQALLDAAREAAHPAEVVGCSSFRSLTLQAQVKRGCVAVYVPAGGCSFGVAAVEPLGHDIFGASRRAAEQALERAGEALPFSALLVVSDGLAGDQREVVRGTYAVTGATVPLVGGAAGAEDSALGYTYQFADGRVLTNGIVAVGINSPSPIGVGVRHGWQPIGRPLIVTRAQDNTVHELDGRPAVEAYFSQRGDTLLDRSSFAGQVMNHPLGLADVSGRYEVRHIMNRTAEDGLVTFGYVGEGAVVRVMESDCDRLIGAAREAASDAVAQLDTPARGALVFSCAARVPNLGDQVVGELAAISAGLGGAPASGFFTYGEFARVTGSTGFHNATVSVLAL